MLAAELIAKYIADSGTEAAFGVVGEANLAIVTAMTDLGVRYVAARREDGGVGMADGWARRTGGTGVATVTTGPGLTNTITALTEAVRARTPLVLVTGLTPPAALHNPQRVEARDLMRATGAGWREARGTEFIADDVFHVFQRASIEGRPQVLAIPQELLYQDVTGLLLSGALPETLPRARADGQERLVPDPGVIERAVEALAGSKRPLIVAGRGASAPETVELLGALAIALGAPLATTLVTNGLFSGHPNAIGICGGLATDQGGELITEADLILTFGCSLNPFTTMNTQLLADSVVVQCDTDAGAIGRWMHPDIAVVGDSETFAERLLAGAGAAREPWADPKPRVTSETSQTQPFVTVDVARRLGDIIGPDATIAFDAGHAVIDVVPHLRPGRGGRFMMSTHFGSIGLGIGMAIGASVGAGDEWTVLAVGDGALVMSLQELDTIRRERLPILVLVFDDGGFGAEVHYSAARGLPDIHAYVDSPPFVAIAEAMGFAAHGVETLDGLEVVAKSLAGTRRPTLVHIPIRSEPMNRWYQQFSALIEPVRWTGFADK